MACAAAGGHLIGIDADGRLLGAARRPIAIRREEGSVIELSGEQI